MKYRYNKIFWRAGQEITPETFIQADNYICAQQNLIRKLINLQYYGLLPIDDTNAPSFTVNATLNGAELSIEQLCCNGVTKEGYLIDFNTNQLPSAKKNRLIVPGNASRFSYVVLRIHPFEHTLVEPVVNEETPFALPVYELDIKELTNIEGNELPVLKIDSSQGHPAIDRNYIPPCMSIRSHQQLLDHYWHLKQSLNGILTALNGKKEQYAQLIYPVSFLLFDLEQLSLNAPPFHLIQLLKKTVKTIGFFTKNAQWTQAQVINAPYTHDDITPTLQALAKCFQEIHHFIGKGVKEEFMPRI